MAKWRQATLDDPIPEAVPAGFEPHPWHVLVMPIGTTERIGSIFITDETRDGQRWTHGIGRVVKLGALAYRSGDWLKVKNFDPDVHAPKPGELVMFNPRSQSKWVIDGIIYQTVPDDQILGRVTRKLAEQFTFDDLPLASSTPPTGNGQVQDTSWTRPGLVLDASNRT